MSERRTAPVGDCSWARARWATLLLVYSGLSVAPCAAPRAETFEVTGPPTHIGSAAELEAAGAVIGRVDIRIDDVFDLSDPREDSGFYRLADRLHRSTRERAIESQLLFAAGEPFSQRKLEESERALRRNGYLGAATVRPVARRANEVDIEVAVRDVWTLVPTVSFGRAGGRNRGSLSIEEHNLLGLGKSLDIEEASDVDRTSSAIRYQDQNVLGSRWRLGLSYADNSDGHLRELAFGRPFVALDSPWSAAGNFMEDDREVPRYALGEEIDRFRLQREFYRFEGGLSSSVENGWARRWLFGFTRDDSQFERLADSALVAALPADRSFHYPWIGWEIYEDDYAKTENLNQIGRVEDLYLGTAARIELGVSPAHGGTPTTTLLDARARTSFSWSAGLQMLQLGATVTGRWQNESGLDNALLETSGEYFWRSGDKHVWYARLDGTLAHDLDPDTQLLLGGDNGLRGYPLRYQAGSARALLTLEHRYFTDWYPFRLMRVGGAVFFDAGRTWGADVVGTDNLGLLKDVGVGLRLGNSRSSHGSVIHLDIAFPLDRSAGIDGVQFLIQTKASF